MSQRSFLPALLLSALAAELRAETSFVFPDVSALQDAAGRLPPPPQLPLSKADEAKRLTLASDPYSHEEFRPHPEVVREVRRALAAMRALVPELERIRETRPFETKLLLGLEDEIYERIAARDPAARALDSRAFADAGAPVVGEFLRVTGARARFQGARQGTAIIVEFGSQSDPRDLDAYAHQLAMLPGASYADAWRVQSSQEPFVDPNLTHFEPILFEPSSMRAIFLRTPCPKMTSERKFCPEADWWFLSYENGRARLDGTYRRRLGPDGKAVFTGSVPWMLPPPLP